MSSSESQSGLTAAIIFAGLAISGSLIFLGYQSGYIDFSAASVQETPTTVEEAGFEELREYMITNNIPPLQLLAAIRGPLVDATENELIENDAIMGDPNAPVTIVEFSDYQCPFCRRHYTQVLPKIKENYIDTGKVKYVFRDFPLGFHADAIPAAMAAECVRDQKGDESYFAFHAKVFDEQSRQGNGTVAIPRQSLDRYASELDVDMQTYTTCMDSEQFKDEVIQDQADGSKYGVNGTPGFVVGNQLVEGAQPYEKFVQAIEAALKQ